jgi:3-phosphoshikimate 1-carboxyvinyltransferase
MALSVAAMAASGESLIHDISCIAKTYPSFVKDFQSIGAKIEVLS